MQYTVALARRMNRRTREGNITKPVEIAEIIEGPQCTAAYIAQLSGKLAALASGARFSNLAQLLARAQLEAELWSRHSKMTCPSLTQRAARATYGSHLCGRSLVMHSGLRPARGWPGRTAGFERGPLLKHALVPPAAPCAEP
jgi:hypothetical protein